MKKLIIAVIALAVAILAYVGFNSRPGSVQVGAASFPVASNLPYADQQELTRVLTITAANRTASESAYLLRRAVYVYNEIFSHDAAGDILAAQGQTLPDGYTGFAKGATFIIIDAANNIRAQYENTGTNTVAVWKVIGQQTATVTLASASYAALNTTPVSLAPSCGSGTLVQLASITGYRVFSSGSWGSTTDGLEVKYVGASGAPVIASFSRGFLSGNGSDSRSSPSYEIRYPLTTLAFNRASASQALVLTTDVQPVVRNHGSTYFKFDVKYNCVTLP